MMKVNLNATLPSWMISWKVNWRTVINYKLRGNRSLQTHIISIRSVCQRLGRKLMPFRILGPLWWRKLSDPFGLCMWIGRGRNYVDTLLRKRMVIHFKCYKVKRQTCRRSQACYLLCWTRTRNLELFWQITPKASKGSAIESVLDVSTMMNRGLHRISLEFYKRYKMVCRMISPLYAISWSEAGYWALRNK